jgi:hypothetical protein
VEGGVLGGAAGGDVLVVEVFVVSGAEQDEVLEFGPATMLVGDQVVCLECAGGAAAGVLAVAGALVQCA